MVKISVRVRPSAPSEKLERDGDTLLVSLKAPAKDGKANLALVKLMAKTIGCSTAEISIVSGVSSRRKMLEVPDFDFSGVHNAYK